MSRVPKLRFKEFSGEWEEKKLGDIATFYNSKRIPLTESDRKSGIYPYYGASGIIDYVEDYIFDGEYILLGEDGANIVMRNSRLVFLAKGKFWVNNHAHIFQAKESNYFLCEALERVNYVNYNTGTAQPKLNAEVVKKIKLRLPILPEQQKIASFLSAVDSKIDQLTRKKELLEQYKKGVMQKIFSQELRFKADDGDEFPEWEEKKINQIFEITRGNVLAVPMMSQEKKDDFQYPVYSSQTKNNGLTGYYNEYLFEDCITWTTDGANAGDANLRRGKFYCTNVCGVLKSDKGYANQCIAEILNTVTKKYVSYVGNPKLMNNTMGGIKITIPSSIDEQTKIANFLSAIDTKIDFVAKQLDEAKNFKKGLLQQMFV